MRNKPTLQQNQKNYKTTHKATYICTAFDFAQPQCGQLLTYNITLTNEL